MTRNRAYISKFTFLLVPLLYSLYFVALSKEATFSGSGSIRFGSHTSFESPSDLSFLPAAEAASTFNINATNLHSVSANTCHRGFNRARSKTSKYFQRIFCNKYKIKSAYTPSIPMFRGSLPSPSIKYQVLLFYLRRIRL